MELDVCCEAARPGFAMRTACDVQGVGARPGAETPAPCPDWTERLPPARLRRSGPVAWQPPGGLRAGPVAQATHSGRCLPRTGVRPWGFRGWPWAPGGSCGTRPCTGLRSRDGEHGRSECVWDRSGGGGGPRVHWPGLAAGLTGRSQGHAEAGSPLMRRSGWVMDLRRGQKLRSRILMPE